MRTAISLLIPFFVACDPQPTDVDDTADLDTQNDSEVDTDTAVDDADVSDLLFLREEEKLARDVYQVLGDEYGVQVFFNIRDSEQRHMDSLLAHIERLGLTDPIVDDTTGVFVDEVLQDLYAELIGQGDADVVAALTVGATIEDLDILDLQEAIDSAEDPALAATYAELMCGSRNHMRAFTRQLDRQGADYTPQFITQAEFDSIVGSGNEMCGG